MAVSVVDFLKMIDSKRKLVDIHDKLKNRSVNEGFSGGEKKRNEIFQMAMLEPTLAILDETDSGLDIDALPHVVNYEMPNVPEDYVHRIGRTGRAGAKGTAISFACEEESFVLPDIEEYIGYSIPLEQIEPDSLPEKLDFTESASITLPNTERPFANV